MMRQMKQWMAIATVTVLLTSACVGSTKEERLRADQMMEAAHKSKNYDRMLTLADSLEQTGGLSAAKANYWRGYACDRMKQADKAEAYWRQSMEDSQSKGNEDMDTYAKAASRLANLLSVKGDYEGTLQMAMPAAKHLEALKRDTTSDYENLLIYINLCRAATSNSDEELKDGFDRAYQKHMENIQKNRNDASYKSAIAGIINIAYYCIRVKKYQYALHYTRDFGELLAEYEQREGVSADYVDRQLGRYDIYKAIAQRGLGQLEEADQTFEAYLETRFSKTPEGEALAEDYLAEARESEPADSLSTAEKISK